MFQSPFGVYGLRNDDDESCYMPEFWVSIAFRRLWVTQLELEIQERLNRSVSIAFRRLWVTQHGHHLLSRLYVSFQSPFGVYGLRNQTNPKATM